MGTNIITLGYHDRNSPRYRTVIQTLSGGGDVVECHTEKEGLFAKWGDLKKKYREMNDKFDIVLVPFPGHWLMPLAWWLTRRPRKQLIFDAFISLYDTDVSDRRRYLRMNPWSWILWMIDWLSMHLADEVLIDTEAHKKFLVEAFGLKPERVKVIYLEARKDLFRLQTSDVRHPNGLSVFFYGTMIPLQGIDVILDAAKLLRTNTDIHFTLVCTKTLLAEIEKRGLTNITFHPLVPIEQLPSMIHASDLCLGIFGTSGKASRVIPHKVMDAIACGKPVITRDSPAIRERFANDPLVELIPAGDARALADAIASRV